MPRALLSLITCCLLSVFGFGIALASADGHWRAVRGWENPSEGGALPFKVALQGVNVALTKYTSEDLPRQVAAIAAAGFVWVRQPFYWAEIEPEPGVFDFSRYDVIVAAVAAQPTLRLVAVLESTPEWARRREARGHFFAPPANTEHFARFARTLAARYADQIDFYQIWDEPNLQARWGGLDPQPAEYAALLAAAYPAIKGNDLDATVIAAGLAPTVEQGPRNISDLSYLRALYAYGANQYFDAAAGKPYGFNTSPEDRTVDSNVLNFSRLVLLREVMVGHGEGHKALWGSHFGWNSLPEGWRGAPSIWGQVEGATQAAWTRAAYRRAAREWAWLGGLILQHWSPDAPADDPIHGFAISEKAAEWFERGAFFQSDVLEVGLHHPTDARLRYEGAWQLGALGADVRSVDYGDPSFDLSPQRLTFRFRGESLALRVRRGDYLAYLYVTIDGAPANNLPQTDGRGYVVLRSANLQPETVTIRLASGLPEDVHEAEIVPYLGNERWILAGIAVGVAAPGMPLSAIGGVLLALIGGVGAVWAIRQMPSHSRSHLSAAIRAYFKRMAAFFSAALLSIVGALSMALTINDLLPAALRRDSFALAAAAAVSGALYLSPHLIITLVALLGLGLLIFNRPVIGLALVAFWTPFFLWPIELYLWAAPMVELSLLATFGAVALRGMVTRLRGERSTGLGLNALDWLMLTFGALGTLSLLWSAERGAALREWRVIVLEPLIFYALLRYLRPTRREWLLLVDVFLMAGAAVALWGLYGFLTGTGGFALAEGGTRRLMSVYSSPNNLALFLGRVFPFGVAMLCLAPGGLRRLGAGALTAIALIALALTQSLGAAMLGIPAALTCVLLLWDWRRGGAILVSLAALALIALPLVGPMPRLQGVLDLSRASSLMRTQLWQASLSMLAERPLTGAGLDQFLYLYRSRYILPQAWEEPDLSHPHNILLDFWIRLGIGGALLLVALQAAFWRRGIRAWRALRGRDRLMTACVVGALGAMANILAHGLVDNSYFVIDLAYIFCFVVAVVSAAPLRLSE
ncbi:MAG: O-antigen ligase family protein [Aggregatilineales bacterium]